MTSACVRAVIGQFGQHYISWSGEPILSNAESVILDVSMDSRVNAVRETLLAVFIRRACVTRLCRENCGLVREAEGLKWSWIRRRQFFHYCGIFISGEEGKKDTAVWRTVVKKSFDADKIKIKRWARGWGIALGGLSYVSTWQG